MGGIDRVTGAHHFLRGRGWAGQNGKGSRKKAAALEGIQISAEHIAVPGQSLLAKIEQSQSLSFIWQLHHSNIFE